jgi:hypothetical protein
LYAQFRRATRYCARKGYCTRNALGGVAGVQIASRKAPPDLADTGY